MAKGAAARSKQKKKQAKKLASKRRATSGAGANADAHGEAAPARGDAAAQNGTVAKPRAAGQHVPTGNQRNDRSMTGKAPNGVQAGPRGAEAAAAAAAVAPAPAPTPPPPPPPSAATANACESARLRAQESIRALFTEAFSPLRIALTARAAAVERCRLLQDDTRRLGPEHHAAQRQRQRCLEELGQASIVAMELSAFARAASRAAIQSVSRQLVASELEHGRRDAFLVNNLIKPVVGRVAGPIGAATLECSLLTLEQLREGKVTGNGEDRYRSYEDGEELLDLDPPVYVELPFLEKMRTLEAEQQALLAKLVCLSHDFEDAFDVANEAARDLIAAAEETAEGVPEEVPFPMLFANLEAPVFAKMVDAFCDAAAVAADRLDCLFYALTMSVQRHRVKDARDEKLLECLRAVPSSPKSADVDAAAVEAVLKEFDDKVSASAAGRAAKEAAGSAKQATAAQGVSPSPCSSSPPRCPAVATRAAADAVARTIEVVFRLRGNYAILESGPASVGASAPATFAVQGAGSVADGTEGSEGGSEGTEKNDNVRTYNEDGYEVFADHWPSPAPRTPEQVAETKRTAPPATRSAPDGVSLADLADDEWQGNGEYCDKDDDGGGEDHGDGCCGGGGEHELLAKFRRLQLSPRERLPMKLATGNDHIDASEHRTDDDIPGLAQRERRRLGPPGRDDAAEDHLSYAALMEVSPPPPGVIPGHNLSPSSKNGPDITERRRQQRLALAREKRAVETAAARAKAEEEAAAAVAAAAAAVAAEGVTEAVLVAPTPSAS